MSNKYKIVAKVAYYGIGCSCCEDTEMEEFELHIQSEGSDTYYAHCFKEYLEDGTSYDTQIAMRWAEVSDVYQEIARLEGIEITEDYSVYDGVGHE